MGNDNVKDYPPYLDYPKTRKPITNADRIRSMTDEELAKFVSGTDFCELLCNDTPVCIDGQCFARLLNWLRQEAKDA